MKVEFVNLKRQGKLLKKEILQIINPILDDAVFVLGKPLEKFEKNFAKFCGKKYCVGLNSGTDAIFLTLLAYGIDPGDEVITAPNSYFCTAGMITNIGAVPIFADINPDNYILNPALIEKAITKKTKAIMPVHLYGQPAEMDKIIRIAQKHNLIILEDCAQAHGTRYKDKIVPVSETGAFSFYPGKNLGSFGDSGCVVTDDRRLAKKLRLLRNDGSIKKYQHEMFGYKSRLDTLQASILDFKLKHLNKWNRQRRQAASLYRRHLAAIKQIKLPIEKDYAYHIYHLFVIECQQRNQLQKYLAQKEITTIIHYPTPIHLQKPYRQLGYKKGDFPITEAKAKRILSLPMFPEITEKEIKYVARQIKEFCSL